MKNTFTIILSILLVLSLAGNVYLFSANKTFTESLASTNIKMGTLDATISEKETVIADYEKNITELETTISDLQTQITELQTKLDNTTVVEGYSIESMEPTEMYVISESGASVRRGPSDDYISDETLKYGTEVIVTGRTSNDWYRVEWEGAEGGVVYISGSLLGLNKPTAPTGGTGGNSGNQGGSSSGDSISDLLDRAGEDLFGNPGGSVPGTPGEGDAGIDPFQ